MGVRKIEPCEITLKVGTVAPVRFDSDSGFMRYMQESPPEEDYALEIRDLNVIPKYFMQDAEHLEELVIGDGVRCVGDSAFAHCPKLKHVHFAPSVVKIGKYAFARNYSLEEIVCGEGFRVIEDGAFCGCSGVTTISLQNGLFRIGRLAFAFCSNLREIYESVDSKCVIQNSAFLGSIDEYVVRANLGKLALSPEPGETAMRVGVALTRYYCEKDGWEAKRLRAVNEARQKAREEAANI